MAKQTPYTEEYEGEWYAVDAYGATDGPFQFEQDANAALAKLPADHWE